VAHCCLVLHQLRYVTSAGNCLRTGAPCWFRHVSEGLVMSIKHVYTENEAQALHDYRKLHSLDHAQGGCWCCCPDCNFDADAILGITHDQGGEPEPGVN
jgi:hypothetical protein